MKALAFNGSPRMEKGNTALILNPFLDGMREVGAEVELLYTKKLNINPCQGCLGCWFKTPGQCFQKDDMQMVRQKLGETDIWVFATPLLCGRHGRADEEYAGPVCVRCTAVHRDAQWSFPPSSAY